MKLLVFGGTRFVGRAIVEHALGRGHEVTVFNRGNMALPESWPVASIQGDREKNIDLSALSSGDWDAVIDVSGYVPATVRAAVEAMRGCAHYMFISTVSVFADHGAPDADESYPLAQLPAEKVAAVTSATQIDGENYGALKALCEAEVARVFDGRSAIVRPGIVVGPNDPTDRFTYWVRRIARGGPVLVPQAVIDGQIWQVIDARDLAAFAVSVTESRVVGVFNATGPRTPALSLFEAAREIARSDARWVGVDADFMARHDLFSWNALPLCVPSGADYAGLFTIDNRHAISAGLTFRPVADTISDTRAWDATRGGDLKVGLSPEREVELLALPPL